MEIKFVDDQHHQLEAIKSVLELFKGQPNTQYHFQLSLPGQQTLEGSLGRANQLVLSDEALLENVRNVQQDNKINVTAQSVEDIQSYDFSIEMETGTGKTYVYLRTIIELHQKYGFSKFIIVVPSVAIREGVQKSLELMRDHFKKIYDNVQYDSYIYDSKKLTMLRQFAQSNTLQIMIMNLDSFNREANIINRPSEDMGGLEPIKFIQQTQPIIIMDEPQNMENENSKLAIKSLNPLVKLRYSATHKNTYQLLYRLDPVKAYDLKLVKRIGVTSVVSEEDFNKPYIELKETKANKTTVSAQLIIDQLQKDGSVKRKKISVKSKDDLYDKSNGRHLYQGYIVERIHHSEQWIRFSNGITVRKGEISGVDRDEMMKVQLEETIRAHFRKEKAVRQLPEGQRLKVLSLVFIDKVANYANEDGKIRQWFYELYEHIKNEEEFKEMSLPDAKSAQGSYFSQDRNKPKDTSGNTKPDDETYNKIMRDKEKLLSLKEPIRFIFSHSALREGWDNPNVFQICTLNETFSEIKKRQELGRGLRLPVNESGTRCTDMQINRLTIIANEHYEDFARALQTEMQDSGYAFEKSMVDNNREKRLVKLLPKWKENTAFLEIWDKIKQKTKYSVNFDTEELIDNASSRIASIRLQRPKIRVFDVDMNVTKEGISGNANKEASKNIQVTGLSIPNIVDAIQGVTQLKRSTIIEILQRAQNYEQLFINPQRFIEQAIHDIQTVLTKLMVRGIKYERIQDGYYEMQLFESKEIESYILRVVNTSNTKSIYDGIEVDSAVERMFAEQLERTREIKFYLKLPNWFKINTPIGTYNPDWAIVKEEDSEDRIYFIAETKGSEEEEERRGTENMKIDCGQAHFNSLEDVHYKVVTDVKQLYI
ncbi:restriction endonuclease [Aneurinibacillus sp. REN35]|uniref:restriction endonuclease n=1 Tax=Aneurinibacillus sp. REN35 TaxID=3237286 RepID=UPI0035287D7A